jgi:two-component system chemotaxis response regulator CheB
MSEAAKGAVAIGASAGALEALSAILPAIPADYPRAILLVVHIPPHRESILAEILGGKCQLAVREAEDKEPILAGVIYVAPPDYHLLVETDRRISLSSEEPVHFSRPSIDVMFATAAEAYRDSLIGVLLTGANQDGAEGLRDVERAGGTVIVQSPETAMAPAMPLAGLALCDSARAMSLAEIASFLCEARTA